MSHPKRHRKRIKMVLPIRVWGTDASGKPFVCLAHTLDVTPGGARIGSFNAPVQLGERIGITRGMKKAHFRVAWIGKAGGPTEEQIGVELLEADKDIWGLQLPIAEPDDYTRLDSQNRAAAAVAPTHAAQPKTAATAAEAGVHTNDLPAHLSDLTMHLQRVQNVLQRSSLHPAVIEEFRSALSQVRNASHIIERLAGSGAEADDSSSAVVLLNTHRIQTACWLCAALAEDLPAVRSMVPKHLLESLVQSVGNLFAQAANFEVVDMGFEAPSADGEASWDAEVDDEQMPAQQTT